MEELEHGIVEYNFADPTVVERIEFTASFIRDSGFNNLVIDYCFHRELLT